MPFDNVEKKDDSWSHKMWTRKVLYSERTSEKLSGATFIRRRTIAERLERRGGESYGDGETGSEGDRHRWRDSKMGTWMERWTRRERWLTKETDVERDTEKESETESETETEMVRVVISGGVME